MIVQKKQKYEAPNLRRNYTIMSSEELSQGKKSFWSEIEISGGVRNLSSELFNYTHLTTLYLSDNNLSSIPAEICRLSKLTYLDASSNKICEIPKELGKMTSLRELILNHNFIAHIPYELGKLYQLITFSLKNNPLDPEFQSIYSEKDGSAKLLSYLLDKNPFSPSCPFPDRKWITLNEPSDPEQSIYFSIMCYNVLSEMYATRQHYPYCPGWCLSWEYRKKAILKQIVGLNSDVVCLEEVQMEAFSSFFLPNLQEQGYKGIFYPKSRAKTMREEEKKFVDGCALFYRTSKFSLIKSHLIEFNRLAIDYSQGCDDMLNRVMTKDNIALLALLKSVPPSDDSHLEDQNDNANDCHDHTNMGDGRLLVICAVHVHWDPEFSDVKLVQAMMMINEIKSFMKLMIDEQDLSPKPSHLPLIMCGDFNSLPDSGVHEFLLTSKISWHHLDFKKFGYQDVISKHLSENKKNVSKKESVVSSSAKEGEAGSLPLPANCEIYEHPFSLESAYSSEMMAYTNLTDTFSGIIDYIFHSKQSFVPLSLLGPIDHDWLVDNDAIAFPNPVIPSDHLPLLVKYEWKKQASPPKKPSNTPQK